jgi:selenocysteine-specific elongation factor
VLQTRPPKAGQRTPQDFDRSSLDPPVALALRLRRAATAGREPADLRTELGYSDSELGRLFPEMEGRGEVVQAGGRWFDAAIWEEVREHLQELLERFHEENPTHAGFSRETLRGAVAAGMPQEAWRDLLAGMERERRVRLSGDEVARAGHEVVLSARESDLAGRIDRGFRDAGLDPPGLEAFVGPDEREAAGPIVKLLIARGKLVRIQGGRLFHGDVLEDLRNRLREHARDSRTIDVAQFKKLANVTRKNAIPLLEQLDAERSTRRRGNLREILLSPAGAGGGDKAS